jgi:hypothetical protein
MLNVLRKICINKPNTLKIGRQIALQGKVQKTVSTCYQARENRGIVKKILHYTRR